MCHPPVPPRLHSLRAKTLHCLVHSCGSNPIMEHAVFHSLFSLISTKSLLYVKLFFSRGNTTWGKPCWTSFADCQVTVWYLRTSPTQPLKREMPRTGSRLSTPASKRRKTNLGDIILEQQAPAPPHPQEGFSFPPTPLRWHQWCSNQKALAHVKNGKNRMTLWETSWVSSFYTAS